MILASISLILLAIYSATGRTRDNTSQFNRAKWIYDDSYLVKHLDERYPYLKLDEDGSYLGPRDYFNFSHVFEPSEEYFDGVNLERHLYDELRAMEISSSIATMDQWHYSDNEELMNSGWPHANKQRCFNELDAIKDLLNKASENSSILFDQSKPSSRNNARLLRFIDSWARPPSETYHGHSYWVGSYRACKMAELKLIANSSPTNFRYCWAKLRAKDWPDRDEMVPATNIRAGICLPISCDTHLANQRLGDIHKLMLFNFAPFYRDRFNSLIEVYCLPNQTGLSAAGKLFCYIVLTWIVFVLALSAYGAIKSTSKGASRQLPALLGCLTLQDNFNRFVSDDSKSSSSSPSGGSHRQNHVDLRSLGLVRLFACIAVCVAHTACAFGWVFNSSTFNIISYRSLPYQIISSILKALDLYMVIGGLLSSYMIMKRFPTGRRHLLLQPAMYFKLIVARYLRFAPVLVLVLAFMKSIYPHLSEGPMWDYGTYKYSMQGQCKRSGWWRILGFPILFDLEGNSYLSECLSVSWYLIADLKISLVAPIIIYLMMSKQKANKWWITLALVLLSTINQYKDLSMQELIYFKQFFHYGQLFGVNILSLTFGEPGYFSAINRLHAVCFGLLAGVRLYQYETREKVITSSGDRKQVAESTAEQKWPFWMRGPFFWAAILWELYDFFLPILVQHNYLANGETPSEETIKLVMVLKSRFDAFIFSIVMLRLVSDLAPKLMQNSLILYKLSKLSYGVFLIHTIVISYVVSAHERSRPDSIGLQFLLQLAFVISVSFLICFPLYLLVESPMAQLLSYSLKIHSSPQGVGDTKLGSSSRRIHAKNKQVDDRREVTKI